MKKKNIFEEEITIPDNVREKADMALASIKKPDEKKRNIHKYRKKRIGQVIAGVACAAIIICAANIADTSEENQNHFFSINVMASGSKEGKLTDIEGVSLGPGFCYSEEKGFVAYDMLFPVIVVGENIKSVTYSVNNGNFSVISKKDAEIVTDGIKTKGINYRESGDFYSPQSDECIYDGRNVMYSQFTIDYEKQGSSDYFVELTNEFEDRWDLIYIFNNKLSKMSMEEEAEWTNEVFFKDTVITCTVEFEDGKSVQKKLRPVCRVFELTEDGEVIGIYESDNEDYICLGHGTYFEIIDD